MFKSILSLFSILNLLFEIPFSLIYLPFHLLITLAGGLLLSLVELPIGTLIGGCSYPCCPPVGALVGCGMFGLWGTAMNLLTVFGLIPVYATSFVPCPALSLLGIPMLLIGVLSMFSILCLGLPLSVFFSIALCFPCPICSIFPAMLSPYAFQTVTATAFLLGCALCPPCVPQTANSVVYWGACIPEIAFCSSPTLLFDCYASMAKLCPPITICFNYPACIASWFPSLYSCLEHYYPELLTPVITGGV
jgi:hypothetical protein